MPGGDRTGPTGQGSKTGRAMGYCSGSDCPGYATGVPAGRGHTNYFGAGRGAGLGTRRGAGRGFRCRRIPGFGRGQGFAAQGEYSGYYYPAPERAGPESEAEFLENRIESLKQEIESLTRRLKSLVSDSGSEKE